MSTDVSVLMSVFNGERYLAEAINGILKQSLENFEFIIVDDGSTDGTGKLLDQFAEKDSRIRLLKNAQSIGLTKSLNKGVAVAKGRYIARQDADDISLPSRLEKQIEYLDGNPEVGVLGCGYEDIDAKGDSLSVNHPPKKHYEIVWNLCVGANVIAHPSVVFKTKLVKSVGGYDEVFVRSQDYALWGALLPNVQFANLEDVLIKRRIHGEQISTISATQQGESSLKALARVCEKILCRKLNENELEALVSFSKHGKGCSSRKLRIGAGLLVEVYEGVSTFLNLTDPEKSRLRELVAERIATYPVGLKARSDLSGRELLFEMVDRLKKRIWK